MPERTDLVGGRDGSLTIVYKMALLTRQANGMDVEVQAAAIRKWTRQRDRGSGCGQTTWREGGIGILSRGAVWWAALLLGRTEVSCPDQTNAGTRSKAALAEGVGKGKWKSSSRNMIRK